MKRFIEITARTEDEAIQLIERELKPNETITGREVLAAPPRGLFAAVGNPEIRMRFAIEPKVSAAPAEPRPIAPAPQPAVAPAPAPAPRRPARPERPAVAAAPTPAAEEGDEYDFEDAESDVAPGHGGKQAPLGTDHPMHDTVHQIVTHVAGFVGVTDVELVDRVADGVWTVDAAGTNVSQLIGKHGRTLDAIQYIVNIIANKGREGRAKLVIDVEGYREKRHKGLVQLANRMYHKVIDSGRQVELEPMSTLDRRTIHLALKDRNGIETFSKGTEPMRRVVIAPTRPAGDPMPPRRPRSGGGYRGNRGGDRPQRPAGEPATEPKSTSVPMFMEDFSDED
ncbi:MAG TPA: RNA-binding cell elongation regulator Jag/EloR [Candidatus Ozemobacteraceae bacterium]|nr:RNA-binding cell elongation regulator Jag/EloR [Candidatus Ozemobacteraceae bacterium]